MNHYGKEEWRLYAEGRIGDREREAYEEHLYVCEMCMSIYAGLLDEQADSEGGQQMPFMEAAQGAAFTERVMAAIRELEGAAASDSEEAGGNPDAGGMKAKREGQGTAASRIPLFRRPLFHYAVAAVITLILMSTGMFHTISSRIGHMESPTNEAREPFSERLMEKTVSVLDAMQAKQRGGEKHE
ncbi:anti-sigma factor family protein [Paenibacillus sp. MBLB4367]|uniref:anti-sigma factor family protein n=1 Tax=Paenibacillus sp. MBLB4367 TaxID=3384767 RepID=UPI00390802FC